MVRAAPTYLAHEEDYRLLVSQFLAGDLQPTRFVEQYFALWKRDRDAQWHHIDKGASVAVEEARLCTVLDRIFTACDSFDDAGGAHTISEAELREEVAELARQRWSNTTI